MAYKFQKGAAVLSGSAKFEDGLVATSVDDATAANIVNEVDDGEIAISKLAANTISGKSLGNNLDSLSVGATSGLSMTSYNGSAAVSDLAVSLKADSGLSKDSNGVAVSLANNKALEFDSGALAVKVKANAGITQDADGLSVNLDGSGGLEFNSGAIRLEAAVAGDGLAHSSGVLSVGVDNSSIETNSDALRVKALGVTNAMLAGSIANAKLANSTISSVALGSNLNNLSPSATGGLNGSAYNGSAAVSNLQIDLTTLPADAAFAVAADKFLFFDASEDSHHTGSFVELATAMAGDGIGASSGVLSVGVDNSSIETNSDALRVKALGVTNAMLAGSIANAKLANSDVTIGSTAIALGGTQASISGLQGLDFQAGNRTIGASIGANNLTLGASNSTVVIEGNLQVNGTTTTIDSTTINVSSSFTFEGPADDHELTLGLVDPTADRTVLLPNNSGVVAIFDPSLSDGELATTLTAAPSEINLLDAVARGSIIHGNSSGATALLAKGGANTVLSSDGTDISYTAVSNAMLAGSITDSKLNQITTAGKVALSAIELDGATDIGEALNGADLFMVDDGAGGTMRKSTLSRLKTFIGAGTAGVQVIGDGNANLQVGINAPNAPATAMRTWTLPNSTDMTPGEVIIVKAYGNSDAQPLTIQRGSGDGGNQEIDGQEENIVLESANAAVSLYYVATNTWIIV